MSKSRTPLPTWRHFARGTFLDEATSRLLALPAAMRRWLELLDTLMAKHRYMKEVFYGSYAPDEPDRFILDLAAEIQALDQLLRDPDRCRFVPVTLAETLVLEETADLIYSLHAAGITTPELIINRLYPDHPCPTCTAARADQLRCLARYSALIQGIGRPWGFPLQPQEPRGIAALSVLWDGVMPLDRLLGSPITLSLPIRVEAPGPYPGPDQRLLVFCGKGGVGKTTLACATALHITPPSLTGAPCCSLVTRPIPWATVWTFPSDPSRLRLPKALPRWEVDANAELAVMRSAYGEELRVFFTKRSSNLDFTFDRLVMGQMMDFAPPGIDELAALARAVVVPTTCSCSTRR